MNAICRSTRGHRVSEQPHRHLARAAVAMAVGLLATLSLAGCDPEPTPSRHFTYTITDSTGKLGSAGRRVVAVHLGLSSCDPYTARATTGIRHTGDAPVLTPGSATLDFTLSMEGAYLESIYIDVDGSNTLTTGDYVWGLNAYDLAGYCVPSVNALPPQMSFDWTAFAGSVGTTTYLGGSNPFQTERMLSTEDGFTYLRALSEQ